MRPFPKSAFNSESPHSHLNITYNDYTQTAWVHLEVRCEGRVSIWISGWSQWCLTESAWWDVRHDLYQQILAILHCSTAPPYNTGQALSWHLIIIYISFVFCISSLHFIIQHLIYLNCRISVVERRGWPEARSVHAELDSTWTSLISARGEGLGWYLTIAESPYFELEMWQDPLHPIIS